MSDLLEEALRIKKYMKQCAKSYDEGDFEFFDLKNDLYYQLFYGGSDYELCD